MQAVVSPNCSALRSEHKTSCCRSKVGGIDAYSCTRRQLGSYQALDFVVSANAGVNRQFAMRGANATDELGITESNSRTFSAALGTGDVLLARPLEGSEINIQAKYRW